MHIRKVLYVLPLLVSVSLTGGCAAKIAKMSVDSMKPIMVEMRNATNKNRDAQLILDAMPAMLVQMDGFIGVSPENRYLLTSAAEANMGYAFLTVEDKDKGRAKFLYLKARDYALRNLMLNKTFRKAYEGGDIEEFTRALNTIHKRDVGPLYLATNSWMMWINLAHADEPAALKDLPRVEAMMDRVLVLDDTHYYGGVHALLGTYYVARPEMFGGQPEDAKAHFQEAFDISESKYLLWHYLYARYYAVYVKDRELFVSTLNKIIAAPPDILPEETFANAAVKKKASSLLLQVDDYFR